MKIENSTKKIVFIGNLLQNLRDALKRFNFKVQFYFLIINFLNVPLKAICHFLVDVPGKLTQLPHLISSIIISSILTRINKIINQKN